MSIDPISRRETKLEEQEKRILKKPKTCMKNATLKMEGASLAAGYIEWDGCASVKACIFKKN